MIFGSVGDWFAQVWKNICDFFMYAPEGDTNNLTRILFALFLIVAGHYLIKLIMFLLRKLFKTKRTLQVQLNPAKFFLSCLEIVLRFLLVIWVLIVLRVDLTSFAGVISAGILAIGLALQDLIANFASGIILLNAKLFENEDFIQVQHSIGVCEGKIKEIRLLTTTLTTSNNQLIMIPNSFMQKSIITNFSRNKTRRLIVEVGVDYDSNIELVKKTIQEVLRTDERIITSPKPIITLIEYSDYSLIFRIIVWTETDSYWDVNFEIREKILLAFRDKKIKIPTRNNIIVKKGKEIDNIKVVEEKDITSDI